MLILTLKRAEVSFFAVADVLEDSISANSETLHKVVLRELSVLGDDVSELSSVVTDGASVDRQVEWPVCTTQSGVSVFNFCSLHLSSIGVSMC